MAEVAGLLLGAIPIAIWALDKYAESFEAFHHDSVTIRTLRADLTTQRKRLGLTYERIGLDKPSQRELEERVKMHFPDISEDILFTFKRVAEILSELLRDLDVDLQSRPLWTNEPPERVTWEWRRVKRSFKVKKRNRLIDELRKYNENLETLCRAAPDIPARDDGRTVGELIQRFNDKRCNVIRERMRSLHRALNTDMDCACSSPHEIALSLDWVAHESVSKAVQIFISYSAKSQQQGLPYCAWRTLQVRQEKTFIEEGRFQPKTSVVVFSALTVLVAPPPSPSRFSKAWFRRKSSKISGALKTFSPPQSRPTTPVPQEKPTAPLLGDGKLPATRLNGVRSRVCCQQLSRRWSLSGYICDPDKPGDQEQWFLLSHADNMPNAARPLPLTALIASPQADQQSFSPALSLKQRFGIAAALCWSVLHLHGSPWLGKEWDTRQLKVLCARLQHGNVSSRHPFISCFLPSSAHQDPTTEQTTLEDNPASQRRITDLMQKLLFDLGVVLIELCLEVQLADLRAAYRDARSEAPTTTADNLGYTDIIREKVERVRHRGGDGYGDAIEKCYKFSFPGSESKRRFEIPDFRRTFYETVVAPVQATYQMMPEISSYLPE
ncbi:hypothetical protein OQA88_8727 [Cercophora sp. LCS_1]